VVKRLRAGMTLPRHPEDVPAARRPAWFDYPEVLWPLPRTLASPRIASFQQLSDALSRDLVAWLGRELTQVTLRELSAVFGLTHFDSVQPDSPGRSRPPWLPSAPWRDRGYLPTAPEGRNRAL